MTIKRSTPRCGLSCLAALAPLSGCGGGDSPTQPQMEVLSCTNPRFGDPADSPSCLPFAAGAAYTVTQSYCTSAGHSHHGRFAYDFDMPTGTGFPHIHFQVCLRGGQCSTGANEVTMPVNFRNAEGPHDELGGLIAGERYAAGACP